MTDSTNKMFDETWMEVVRREVSASLGLRYAPEDIEDVVQEAVVALLQRTSPSDDGVVLNSARYAVLRFLSKQPPSEVLESELGLNEMEDREELEEEHGTEAHHFLTCVTNETPESFAMADDTMRNFFEFVAELPEDQAAAYLAKELQGMSYTEVARSLGVTRRTAYEWIKRCRNDLEESMKRRLT